MILIDQNFSVNHLEKHVNKLAKWKWLALKGKGLIRDRMSGQFITFKFGSINDKILPFVRTSDTYSKVHRYR